MADPLENASLLKPGKVGTGISSKAMEAIPRGAEAMGRAIAGVGQEMHGIYDKMQEAENAAIMSDFRRGLRETAAEAERDMLQDPTGNTWQEIVDNRMNSYEGTMKDMEGAGPEVRREMEIYMNDFRSKLSQDVQTKAMLAKFERMETAAMAEHDQLLSRGDIEGADAVITALPTWSPEKKAAFNQKARKKHEMNVLDAQVTNDPWAEPAYPEWVTPADQTRWEKKRVSNQNAYMSEELQDITKDIQAGHLFDKDEIAKRLDESPIMSEASERDRQVFYQNAKKQLPMDRDEIAGLRQMITSLGTIRNEPGVTDEIYQESWNKMAFQLSLNANRPGIEELWEDLNYRSIDSLHEAQKDYGKKYVLDQLDALNSQADANRLAVTDTEKKSKVTEVDNWVASELKRQALQKGGDAIREFDDTREDNSPTWLQRKEKELRNKASGLKDMGGLLDVVFPEDVNMDNPLLPPKENALGE